MIYTFKVIRDYIKDPDWANPDNLVATIGHHEFYKP